MTEAINIGNLPAITSLPTGTYMVAIDSNGQLAKITKANATNATYSSSCSSPQWIRIGSFSQTAGCLLSIGSQWRNTQGVRILLNCLLHVNAPSYNHIEVLSVLANTGTNVVFKKCRVVIKSGSAGYLDVYYEAPNQNSVFFSASANYYFNLYDSPQLDAQIPDGYSVKEFDIPTVGGGVKRFASTPYILTVQAGKGGRHDRSTSTQQRDPQIADDRRIHTTGQMHRLQHLHHAWLLQGLCQCGRNTIRGIRLRAVVGHSSRLKLRVADIHPQSPEHLRQEPLGRLATLASHSHRVSRYNLMQRKEVVAA